MDIEKMLEKCILCPRKCGVNRTNGSTGACHTGKKSGYHGLHFTCGKNLAYQVKMDQVPYFFPVALLDAVSARTKIFPEAEQEKKYP